MAGAGRAYENGNEARIVRMTKKTRRDDQITEVINEEKNRARRPLAAEAERSRKEKLRIIKAALQIATEADFLKAMQSYGLTGEELKLALEAWREGPS
jgi:hypothetical protein